MMFEKLNKALGDYLYLLFRVLVAVLFFGHGAQKLLGWFGGQMSPAFNLFWWAGLIEFTVGILVFFGLFTRLAALVAGIEMLVAFFYVHLPTAVNPYVGGGELPLLYFSAFLVLFIYGGRKWMLESLFCKKETF